VAAPHLRLRLRIFAEDDLLNRMETRESSYRRIMELLSTGREAQAFPELARFCAFYPDDADALELWVGMRASRNHHQAVIDITRDAVARGVPPSRFQRWVAMAHYSLGEREPAEAIARAVIADPHAERTSEMVVLLSRILQDDGRFEEALDTLRDGYERTRSAEVLFERLQLAMKLPRPDIVIEDSRRFLKEYGRAAAVFEMLGHAHASRGDLREAERAFRDAAAEEPGVARHHANVVLAMMSDGRAPAADAYLMRLAETDVHLAESAIAIMRDVAGSSKEPEGDAPAGESETNDR
jgi:tetratricopeptide (TPR) repeat protein